MMPSRRRAGRSGLFRALSTCVWYVITMEFFRKWSTTFGRMTWPCPVLFMTSPVPRPELTICIFQSEDYNLEHDDSSEWISNSLTDGDSSYLLPVHNNTNKQIPGAKKHREYFAKNGKFRTSERGSVFRNSGKSSRLGQIWVKHGFRVGFDPNRRWIYLGQGGGLFNKNNRFRNFCAPKTAVFTGRRVIIEFQITDKISPYPHPQGARLWTNGFSHDLINSPLDCLLPSLRSGRSFESRHRPKEKWRLPKWAVFIFGSEYRDSNPRPLGPEIAQGRKSNSVQSIQKDCVHNSGFCKLSCPTCPYSSDVLWVTVWVSQSCHSAKVGVLGTF